MKLNTLVASLLLVSSLGVVGAVATAADKHVPAAPTESGKLIEVTEKDAAWLAKARQDYPLKVCVVSDEDLGSMGDAPEYIYRVAGQPDRLVVVCCDGCSEDFLSEPARFLAKIDAAKKDGAKAEKGPDAGKHETGKHEGHR
jgi:hypothetical protein